MDCIFCKIVQGDIPSKKVYEDDKVFAFEDINPIAPIHILVIPKMHISGPDELADIEPELAGHLIQVAARLAKERDMGSGYRLVLNNGLGAGQTVMHLHVHLMGGRQFGWPPG